MERRGRIESNIDMCAIEVFGDSFKYKRQWLSPCGREWALEFETEIGNTGKIMNGIDLVSLVGKRAFIRNL